MNAPRGHSKAQWLLLIIFIASTGALLAMWLVWGRGVIDPGIEPSVEFPPSPSGLFWLILAAATSLASLTGLVSTTILGWRKEQREARAEALAKRRQELEIQKLEIELSSAKVLAEKPSKPVDPSPEGRAQAATTEGIEQPVTDLDESG